VSWDTPPDKITEARDAMLACAGASTLGLGSAASYHYPLGNLRTSALPFCVLEETDYTAERNAPGESYAQGRITATIYADPAVLAIGAAEQAGRALAHELSELTGDALFITRATRGLASKVRRSKIAATVDGASRSYFTMQVSIEWQG